MPLTVDTSLQLPAAEFYATRHRKDLIILHHTAGGSARSTFDWWRTDPKHIGTAYIVERDGTIYNVFPEDAWAYHLGLKGTSAVDKRSIGIEIACEGGLLERGGAYYAFDRLTERTRFTGAVYDHGSVYRSYRHFAAYTPQAIASVCALVDDLLTRFQLPRQTPANHRNAAPVYRSYSGVLSHIHLRVDKTDVHPGFPWQQLVASCNLVET